MIIGFICGAWDLLHPGHLYTLKECKNYCDRLVVGLHVDPSIERKNKHKPIQTIFERWYQLGSCKWVDEVIPYETSQDLKNILSAGKFDVRFLGEDYLKKQDQIVGEGLVPIKYIKRNHSYSSSELRERLK